MNLKSFSTQLNIFQEARNSGIPLWQSPQFLFIVMGIIIIFSTVISYVLGLRYIGDPQTSVLLILALASIQLIIAFVITRSFERLVEANRMKSEFVSIVSHQLRSPLTNLKWALDALHPTRRDEALERGGNYLDIITENTERMHELVNDLLTVSRMEQGTLPLQNQTFAFDQLVKDIITEFKPFLEATNITLNVEGGEGLSEVYSDLSRLRQVMANFLDNAIRYAKKDRKEPSQERRITVRYYKEGRNLHFEVEDNGIGIPQEDQKYIFEKFFRSRNAVRHQTQGTGLGLHIAKSIIAKANGEIGFESEEKEGSTFWFIIPLS